MEDIKVELLEDSGVITDRDGGEHNVKLLSIQFASPLSRWHNAQVFVVAYSNQKGVQTGERAMKNEVKARGVYSRYVRDAKYGELKIS